jgi:hypothetical protein
VIGGTLGLHRFYLHGRATARLAAPAAHAGRPGGRDPHAQLGQDDRLAWVLIPLLG